MFEHSYDSPKVKQNLISSTTNFVYIWVASRDAERLKTYEIGNYQKIAKLDGDSLSYRSRKKIGVKEYTKANIKVL